MGDWTVQNGQLLGIYPSIRLHGKYINWPNGDRIYLQVLDVVCYIIHPVCVSSKFCGRIDIMDWMDDWTKYEEISDIVLVVSIYG